MPFRRMLPFLLLNILVSAAVVIAVLWWWDSREPDPEPVAAALPQAVEVVSQTPGAALSAETAAEPAEEADERSSEDPGAHTVKAGETLGQISLQYDISVEAIMAANNIDNPNFLSVGQELVIPKEGEPLPQPEPTEESTEENAETTVGRNLPTPIPTEPALEGEAALAISEVIGAGEVATEAIQIVNNGSREAALANWSVSDQLGNTYTFGQLTLFGDGAGIFLHTGTGQDSATELFWGLEEALWNSGDRVVLYDDGGKVQAEFQVP
jgi:LysM repeat protein